MTRGFTPEDLLAIQLAEDPQISPDGAHVAFVRTEIDRDRYEYHRSIWLVATDGGEPRRLTNGPGDTAPRWSPDGRTLAFLRGPSAPVEPKNRAERDSGKSRAQLWLLPLGGGEPRQLTSLRYGAGVAAWSPDGGALAFAAQTGQPDDHEVDDAAFDEKKFPRVRTIDLLFHKLDGVGYTYELRSHLFSIPSGGGDARQLTDGDWNDGEPRWSPDGRSIVFTSDRSDERWSSPADSVWTLDLVSGALTRLTEESLGAAAPTYSPDGAKIAFIGSPRRHGDGHTDLYVTDAQRSEPGQRQLSSDFTPDCSDSCIDDQRSSHGAHPIAWSADSREILFLAASRGTTQVYAAPADGSGQPRNLTSGSIHVYAFSADHGARTLALGISTPVIPGDIFAQSLTSSANGGAPRRLTDVNAALLAEVEVAEPEEFTFTGADGWQIQGWTLRPPQADREQTLPAILEVHGGPAAMYGYSFFLEFQLLAARGYAVVYVNPRGSTGYGRVFSGAVIKDWGGKDFEDIMAGLDAAIARGGIDPNRLGVAGGSYGGFMTTWTVGHTDRFKAAVAMRSVTNQATMFGVSDIGWWFTVDELGATPWDDLDRLMRFSPINYVKNVRTPLLLIHSDNDLRCPLEQSQQMYTALKFLGQETRLVIFEGQSHDLSRTGHPRSRVRRLNEIVGWFEQYNPR
ncbi:MAG TPA: S9 family peptidase [Ktedonobacterales bacterium]